MPFGIRRWVRLQRAYSKEGYTLIEVLIATAVFSAMVTLASLALDQGLRQYRGLMDRGITFWDNARYLWMNKSFASAVDYYVHSRGDGWFPYFRGTQEIISYVSGSPLAGDQPVIVWIRNERQEDGRRSWVYYEQPVYAKGLEAIERDTLFGDFKKGNSITLLKDLEALTVSFYGYDPMNKQASWTADFDGRKRRFLPELIKVDYQDTEEKVKKTMLFGIKTHSPMKTVYNERYPHE
ncbi:MAG: prepilin-type N-terminal cleavage/methylation domain-containing protein [Nitrospirota bacterium]